MKHKDNEKRQQIIHAVAAHLVEHGFSNSGLRALAKSAGTSDRMVMYYFATKEELIAEALSMLATELALNLESIIPESRATSKHIFESMIAASHAPEVRSVLKLWFEIVGLGIRDDGPYKVIAIKILNDWNSWICRKLGPSKAHMAPELLAKIEGSLMIALIKK